MKAEVIAPDKIRTGYSRICLLAQELYAVHQLCRDVVSGCI